MGKAVGENREGEEGRSKGTVVGQARFEAASFKFGDLGGNLLFVHNDFTLGDSHLPRRPKGA